MHTYAHATTKCVIYIYPYANIGIWWSIMDCDRVWKAVGESRGTAMYRHWSEYTIYEQLPMYLQGCPGWWNYIQIGCFSRHLGWLLLKVMSKHLRSLKWSNDSSKVFCQLLYASLFRRLKRIQAFTVDLSSWTILIHNWSFWNPCHYKPLFINHYWPLSSSPGHPIEHLNKPFQFTLIDHYWNIH